MRLIQLRLLGKQHDESPRPLGMPATAAALLVPAVLTGSGDGRALSESDQGGGESPSDATGCSGGSQRPAPRAAFRPLHRS